MKIKIVFFFLMITCVSGLMAQELADYKYIIVPQKFEFQDEEGEYELNGLTRFLFIKYGFNAYLENEALPADLNESGCNTLYARADVSGFLSTNASITLVNCRGKEVFALPEGKSKIKSFKEGHQDAFRKAFAKLEDMGYSYSDEIVTKATITEGENAENLVPEIRKMQAKKEEVAKKEVRVSSVINTKQETVQEEKELTTNDVKDSKSISNQNPSSQSNAELVLVSGDGSFTLKSSVSGFDVYEGSTKIGTATKTSAGSYLVSTSEFTGVGFYDNNQFTIEREIKGVSGLVKMIFTEK
ncbi:hypothetical protein [Leeuwenhoekiella aequorea]|uniref:Uncharacterized protein n=1 Tax=Leeuwenhoekiella aequorea TaxID=283736 RepID=A0A4Q0P8L7_9FLAO|nr:hypothetical protein [Leeuwenhoekiella aequorea]RXG22698.1 hypothetical protein DSM00_1800 [Leeuwenhoekiella aequorea]